MQKIRLTRSNKRERTITITKYLNGKAIAIYRSISLPQTEWEYYTNDATENDLRHFLKSDDYYIVSK